MSATKHTWHSTHSRPADTRTNRHARPALRAGRAGSARAPRVVHGVGALGDHDGRRQHRGQRIPDHTHGRAVVQRVGLRGHTRRQLAVRRGRLHAQLPSHAPELWVQERGLSLWKGPPRVQTRYDRMRLLWAALASLLHNTHVPVLPLRTSKHLCSDACGTFLAATSSTAQHARHLGSELPAPGRPALRVDARKRGAQLLGDCRRVAAQRHGCLGRVARGRLRVHEHKLGAGRPLGRLAKVQLPVQPAAEAARRRETSGFMSCTRRVD